MALWFGSRRPLEVTVNLPERRSPPQAEPPPLTQSAPPPPDGLSPFSARVLDQLSLTAWLPAALVVANIYLVVGMYLAREGNGGGPTIENLQDAVAALNEKPIGVILAVLFGVVLVTLVTQSLEFAAIRLLEGYWGGSILASLPTRVGVRLQKVTLGLLSRRAAKLERRAFAAAAPLISEDLDDRREFATVVLVVGREQPTSHWMVDERGRQLLDEAHDYYVAGDWLEHSPAHLRHRLNSLYVKRKAFPCESSRLMPTRLGNTLRAFESKLSDDAAGSEMRGYLYQRLDAVGPALMRQHDQ